MRTADLVVVLGFGLVATAACSDDPPVEPTDAGIDAAAGLSDIDFTAGLDLPAGSWLLVNDWVPDPNPAFVLPVTDLAAAPRVLFTVNRVWSMGATRDGATIYFSAWDSHQEEHYGVTIGDAIQNTFAYQPASRAVWAVALGNLNDECHQPSPDGMYLYVCRRYDFTPDVTWSGWRVGRIDLVGGGFQFLRADDPGGPYELNPLPLPGGGAVLFEERARPPATGDTLKIRDLTSGAERTVLTQAGRPSLAPDGHRVLFQDRSDQSHYKTIDLDQPAAPPVPVTATTGAGAVAWSPDGNTLLYAVYDQPLNCDHLERVTFDGQSWSTPTRVRDCATTGEFITDLAWLEVP